MPNTIANVPFIAFVKYNTATTAANRMRIILSAEPVFFSYFIDLIIYKFIYILPSAAIRYIRLVAIIFTVRTSNTGIAILEYYPTYVSATEKH